MSALFTSDTVQVIGCKQFKIINELRFAIRAIKFHLQFQLKFQWNLSQLTFIQIMIIPIKITASTR
ncbi:hypothetical protein VI06_06815 [Aquitalea magnusonii]|nr:hypothetical protein VI06_06815 [Aquitalea magnusonii]